MTVCYSNFQQLSNLQAGTSNVEIRELPARTLIHTQETERTVSRNRLKMSKTKHPVTSFFHIAPGPKGFVTFPHSVTNQGTSAQIYEPLGEYHILPQD